MSDPIGSGKWRIGPKDTHELRCDIPTEYDDRMAQLKMIKGVQKRDMILLGLDMVLSMPVEEVIDKINERKKGLA